MNNVRRPLNRSIAISSVVFFVIICVVLLAIAYLDHSRSLYGLYEQQMTNLLEYADSHIDHDDLAKCVETKQESEKYHELQLFMDDLYTNYDMHYLYILKVEDTPNGIDLIDVMTAFWPEDYENGDPDIFYLGASVSQFYPDSEIAEMKRVYDTGQLAFFEDESDYGLDYTGALPLRTSNGEVFALLCVDMELDQIRATIWRNMTIPAVVILVLGMLFVVAFYLWTRKNITRPIIQLEKSVKEFASTSHAQGDPAELNYDSPPINTENEVESLSNAITQMADDIKDFAIGIANAQSQVELMQTRVNEMDQLAYQDALTRVKNKTAYQEAETVYNQKISDGNKRIGMVMVDVNYLKQINDTFGHEHGDEYIVSTVRKVCEVFKHSPVYRIGGDEFVVLLENHDYDHRDELLAQLKTVFRELDEDKQLEPWEKPSAAVGMAVIEEGDASLFDLFKRADQAMYHDKRNEKAWQQEHAIPTS